MSLVLAALGPEQALAHGLGAADLRGAWPVPAGVPLARAMVVAEALGRATGKPVLQLPWAACTREKWLNSKDVRQAVWFVADAPQRALASAKLRRLAKLPAAAVVVHGPSPADADRQRHRALVTAAAAALQASLADPQHPLAHWQPHTLDCAALAAYADTVADFDELILAASAAVLAQGSDWPSAGDSAVIEVLLHRFDQFSPRARPNAVALWLSSLTVPVDADESVVRRLRRSGMLQAAGDSVQWSALAKCIGNEGLRARLTARRPEWPWQLTGAETVVQADNARAVTALFAAFAIADGLRPRQDADIEGLGVTALRVAVDAAFDKGGHTRNSLTQWLDLALRIATTPADAWREDDCTRLLAAESSRQRLAEAATTANARFAVAATFDALAMLADCGRNNAAAVVKQWPGLRWTLERLGPPSAPALAWLRVVAAHTAMATADEHSAAAWQAELAHSQQQFAEVPAFQPALRRAQAWNAWHNGDADAAKTSWTAAGQLASKASDAQQTADNALDLAMAMLATGDLRASRRVAKSLAVRLTQQRDRVRGPLAIATWLLSSLATPLPAAGKPPDVDADPAQAYELWMHHAKTIGLPQLVGEGIDWGAVVRMASLLADGRAAEVQPLLTYAAKTARKSGQPGVAVAAQFALGACAAWLGDRTAARRNWSEAISAADRPGMAAFADRLRQFVSAWPPA